MSVTKEQILDELRRVKGPDLEGNIVELGLVSEILIKDERVYFSITVPVERAQELEPLRKAAEKVVSEIEGVAGVTAVLTAEAKAEAKARATAAPAGSNGSRNVVDHPRVQQARAAQAGPGGRPQAGGGRQAAGVPGVKHLIAVASGKGGVGKSTTAVNLALGFRAIGLKAGILDADIYGPSQPRLLGLTGRPQVVSGTTLRPMQGYGLQVMSMGFLVDEGTPIIWRGPMVVSALNQMLREVAWDDLDVMVIDMPPGTGDVQLTMAQQVPLSGAIIVSTPQDLALIDARKGLNMFRKVDVPVLGIVENMSYFICPKCGERSDIFGHGGAENEAEKLGIPFLGAIPLHIEIRERSDSGQPVVATNPDSPHAQIFREIAARSWAEAQAAQGARVKPPRLDVSPSRDALKVTFEGGQSCDLSAEMLRVMSPSAEVQGHSPDQRVTVARKRNVKIKELRPIGNYAVRIVFDDGHDTGLYAWSYLELLGREKEQRWAGYVRELEQKGLSRG
ncbi:MAG: iron-sulfur cluster carrier protein ApbC [Hyphomicrobiaceae bacterium]|nr:iron-sulfur cluster carrier protein ApbC [Hyphomicrobiaceae bacterium]